MAENDGWRVLKPGVLVLADTGYRITFTEHPDLPFRPEWNGILVDGFHSQTLHDAKKRVEAHRLELIEMGMKP